MQTKRIMVQSVRFGERTSSWPEKPFGPAWFVQYVRPEEETIDEAFSRLDEEKRDSKEVSALKIGLNRSTAQVEKA
jgi:hypothetical protein